MTNTLVTEEVQKAFDTLENFISMGVFDGFILEDEELELDCAVGTLRRCFEGLLEKLDK